MKPQPYRTYYRRASCWLCITLTLSSSAFPQGSEHTSPYGGIRIPLSSTFTEPVPLHPSYLNATAIDFLPSVIDLPSALTSPYSMGAPLPSLPMDESLMNPEPSVSCAYKEKNFPEMFFDSVQVNASGFDKGHIFWNGEKGPTEFRITYVQNGAGSHVWHIQKFVDQLLGPRRDTPWETVGFMVDRDRNRMPDRAYFEGGSVVESSLRKIQSDFEGLFGELAVVDQSIQTGGLIPFELPSDWNDPAKCHLWKNPVRSIMDFGKSKGWDPSSRKFTAELVDGHLWNSFTNQLLESTARLNTAMGEGMAKVPGIIWDHLKQLKDLPQSLWALAIQTWNKNIDCISEKFNSAADLAHSNRLAESRQALVAIPGVCMAELSGQAAGSFKKAFENAVRAFEQLPPDQQQDAIVGHGFALIIEAFFAGLAKRGADAAILAASTQAQKLSLRGARAAVDLASPGIEDFAARPSHLPSPSRTPGSLSPAEQLKILRRHVEAHRAALRNRIEQYYGPKEARRRFPCL